LIHLLLQNYLSETYSQNAMSINAYLQIAPQAYRFTRFSPNEFDELDNFSVQINLSLLSSSSLSSLVKKNSVDRKRINGAIMMEEDIIEEAQEVRKKSKFNN
jgi:hypothetical protein